MNTKIDKVSIVVVTYNRLSYLKLTIQSILNQSYLNFELIIIGDGYQKEVSEYISLLNDNRIIYSYVEHFGYPGPARNYGIELSSGDYIAFCDDDDLWLQDKLSKQISMLKDTNSNFCFTNRISINEHGKLIDQKKIKWIPKVVTVEKLFLSNFITYSSVVVSKNLFNKKYLFSEERKHKGFEDYHLWLRLMSISKPIFMDEFLVQYRIHSGNISGKLSIGAYTNIKLFNDLMLSIKIDLISKFVIFIVAYIKWLYYLLRKL